jgi:hypothetical protein
MKNWITLMMLGLALGACQKEKNLKTDYLAWKGSKAISIDNQPTLGLLDCRSLKSEKEHYYLESYMAWPNKSSYTQSVSDQGQTVTHIPLTDLYLLHVTQDESQSHYEGQLLVEAAFRITQVSETDYLYEIIATPATEQYFSAYGTVDLKNIKTNDVFMVIESHGNQYKVTKHPEGIFVNESFTCQQSNQGKF